MERAEEAVVLSTPASCMASGSRAPARRGFICHCFCVRRTPSISIARIAAWTRTGCIAGPMVKTGIMAIMLRQKQDSPWAIPTAQLDCIQCCSLEMARVLSGTPNLEKRNTKIDSFFAFFKSNKDGYLHVGVGPLTPIMSGFLGTRLVRPGV